jgi:hypothetical protein
MERAVQIDKLMPCLVSMKEQWQQKSQQRAAIVEITPESSNSKIATESSDSKIAAEGRDNRQ